MFAFLCIAIGGFILLAGGLLGGHDHDHDFGHDHSFGHDHGGHGGHGVDHGNMPTVSIFSVKVIGTFIMCFGTVGAIATYYGASVLTASLIATGGGVFFALVMYGLLRVLYSQQSNSLISTSAAVGQTGTVLVEIPANGLGQVEVLLAGQNRTYLARGCSSRKFAKGSKVAVVGVSGSNLIVDMSH